MQNEVFALEGRDLLSRRCCSGYPQHSNSIRGTRNQWEARELGNESCQALDARGGTLSFPVPSGHERRTAVSPTHLLQP